MYYPTLNETTQSRQMLEAFGGYNHNLKINDGEWYDEKNLTASNYPLFSQRARRGTLYTPANTQGIHAKDALLYVDGATLYYNGLPVSGLTLSTDASMIPKTLISMGAYCVIFPDKKYINTTDLTDYGSLDASWDGVTGGTITYTMCRNDGTNYDLTGAYIGDATPTDPTNGMYWIDTSTTPHALKQYSSTSAMWIAISTTYVKIACSNIGANFAEYDGITLSGLAYTGDRTATGEQITALNGDYTIYARGTDYIVVAAMLDQTYTHTITAQTIPHAKRECPTLDFVCEANNRLWGCRYGYQGSEVVNEIYACKLGDFKNWRCYMGLSTDSYAATVGTDGRFTGCIAYGGYPIFFKENYIHKLYGSYPAQYQIQTTTCRGVQQGSEKSLCVVNERLYYKSRTDVCVYDGSLPTGISEALGDARYYDAAAGAMGKTYYISMRDANNVYTLYTYDVDKGIWHKEDNTRAAQFVNVRGDLAFWEYTTGKIYSVAGSGSATESELDWEAVSGIYGFESPDAKYLSRFIIRAKLDHGARLSMALEYDSEGGWEEQGTVFGNALTGSITIPVIPRRCDHLRLKLYGHGNVRIFSIARTYEQGGDE